MTNVVADAILACGTPRATARSLVIVLWGAGAGEGTTYPYAQESFLLPVHGRRSNARCSKTINMLLTTGQVSHAARRDSPFTFKQVCIFPGQS